MLFVDRSAMWSDSKPMQGPQWYAPPTSEHVAAVDPSGDATQDPMLEPATFGIRAAARIIDIIVSSVRGVIGGAIGGIVVAIFAAAGVIADWEDRGAGKGWALTFLLGTLGNLAYETLSEGHGGATIGKLACGLRVIREDRGPCTIGKALGRNLAYFIDALFFGLVAWSAISNSPMKQRLGDRWAGTLVVKAATVPAGTKRSAIPGIVLGFLASCILHVVSAVLNLI
jgi:uncharacterized RDD family membrane protein YckC